MTFHIKVNLKPIDTSTRAVIDNCIRLLLGGTVDDTVVYGGRGVLLWRRMGAVEILDRKSTKEIYGDAEPETINRLRELFKVFAVKTKG